MAKDEGWMPLKLNREEIERYREELMREEIDERRLVRLALRILEREGRVKPPMKYKLNVNLHSYLRKYKALEKLQHPLQPEIDILLGESKEGSTMLLEAVGLRPEEVLGKYPHQLSGGQRQRLMLARAFLIRPELIIADEPVSMIDASSRANILNLMLKIKEGFRYFLHLYNS